MEDEYEKIGKRYANSLEESMQKTIEDTWVGLKPEQVQFYAAQHRQLVNAYYDAVSDTNVITETFNATAFYKTIEASLRKNNT